MLNFVEMKKLFDNSRFVAECAEKLSSEKLSELAKLFAECLYFIDEIELSSECDENEKQAVIAEKLSECSEKLSECSELVISSKLLNKLEKLSKSSEKLSEKSFKALEKSAEKLSEKLSEKLEELKNIIVFINNIYNDIVELESSESEADKDEKYHLKSFAELKSEAEKLTSEEAQKLSELERVISIESKADRFTLVRFIDLKRALDDELSELKLAINVDYCKDDRLSLFYLVSKDENKQSYIAKMYLYSVTSDKARYQIFLHKRLLDIALSTESVKSYAVKYKNTFVFEASHESIVTVLKNLRALSK